MVSYHHRSGRAIKAGWPPVVSLWLFLFNTSLLGTSVKGEKLSSLSKRLPINEDQSTLLEPSQCPPARTCWTPAQRALRRKERKLITEPLLLNTGDEIRGTPIEPAGANERPIQCSHVESARSCCSTGRPQGGGKCDLCAIHRLDESCVAHRLLTINPFPIYRLLSLSALKSPQLIRPNRSRLSISANRILNADSS